MNIVPQLTQRLLPSRKTPAVAFVIHTTGDSDLAKIMRFYTSVDGLQPHDMIDYDGTIYQIATENRVAFHCKIEDAEARLYQRGWAIWNQWKWKNGQPFNIGFEFTGYETWKKTWAIAGIQSPLNLITGEHPNFRAHGIELRQPNKPGPRIFTDAQYQALAERLKDVGGRLKIPLSRKTILGHYDCSPMRRSTAAGGWDPGEAFDWNWVIQKVSPIT